MNALIERIFQTPELRGSPPVLLDVGASGKLPNVWRSFAHYAICIAFDADDRELGYIKKEDSRFRQLYVYNKIVTDESTPQLPFYLTCSPYCSSLLVPRSDELSHWQFADLFQVEKTIDLPTIRIADVLAELGLRTIDWFKADSQGIDLRLFRSIGAQMEKRVLVAEFEPGILDAYEGEDKLWAIMKHMQCLPFWVAAMTVHNVPRIDSGIWKQMPRFQKNHPGIFLKGAAAWAELCYMNDLSQEKEKRSYLLGWVFSMANRQYGFALSLCDRGKGIFGDEIFCEMRRQTKRMIGRGYLRIPHLLARKVFGR